MSDEPLTLSERHETGDRRLMVAATSSSQTIRCKKCNTPILRIGCKGGGMALQASIAGWEWSYGRLRIVLRCASCGQRRRFNIEDVEH